MRKITKWEAPTAPAGFSRLLPASTLAHIGHWEFADYLE